MARRGRLVADHDHGACIDAALDRAGELCARRGARLTRLRRRVLELVWQGHAAVKAYDLLASSIAGRRGQAADGLPRARFPDGARLVHRLESLNAYVGCPQPEAPHDGKFLICEACGQVSEFDAPAIQSAIAMQAADVGFAVGQQMVEVHGVCRGCQPAMPSCSS